MELARELGSEQPRARQRVIPVAFRIAAVAAAEAGVGAPDDVAMKKRGMFKKIKRSCLCIITEMS